VNAYVPPQPTPERCFAFGQALAHAIEREGRRAVVLASGGLSHYPGTPQYPHPDIATDRVIFERLAAGNLRYLLSLDAAALDRDALRERFAINPMLLYQLEARIKSA